MQPASYIAKPNLPLPDIGDKIHIDVIDGEVRFFVRKKNQVNFNEVSVLPGMAVWLEGLTLELKLDYGLGDFSLARITDSLSLHIVGDCDRDYDVPIRDLSHYPSVTLEVKDAECLKLKLPILETI